MKKLLLIISVLMLLCGCGTKNQDAYEKLSAMESYMADAEVTYISNKGENTFRTVQYAKKDGRYCIETLSPEIYSGTSLVYDGKLVWQKTQGVENKIKVTSNSPEKALLLIYTFLENHSRSMQDASVSVSSAPNGDQTVLEADIPGENTFFATEKLWVSNKSGAPEKLVVYNTDGEEKIVVKFSGFRYNEIIDDAKFTIN